MSNVRSAQTDKVRFFGNTTPQELAAQYGTPLYVYNEDVLRRRCRELLGLSSLPGFHVNYSAKANTNLALLRIVREEGCHADAMSPGELHINKLAGFTPDRLLYVCNNVSAEEMKNAADNGLIVSVDSLSQLDQYGKVNPGGKVMIRINPGIGAGHHKKVITAGKETKFGIDPTSLDEVRALLKKHSLTLAGVNQHIGSLFMEPDNYLNAIEFLLHFVQSDLADLLPGIEIIDFGGGLGIPYRKYEEEPRLDMAELGRRLHALLSAWVEETGYKGKFFIEPGRYVVAECGVLLGTVHATKFNGENRYVGTDLGFNVLVRPAMYDSFHDIEIFRDGGEPDTDLVEQSIVGNICESGDILFVIVNVKDIRLHMEIPAGVNTGTRGIQPFGHPVGQSQKAVNLLSSLAVPGFIEGAPAHNGRVIEIPLHRFCPFIEEWLESLRLGMVQAPAGHLAPYQITQPVAVVQEAGFKHLLMQPGSIETGGKGKADVTYQRLLRGRCVDAVRIKALIQHQPLKYGLSIDQEAIPVQLHLTQPEITLDAVFPVGELQIVQPARAGLPQVDFL